MKTGMGILVLAATLLCFVCLPVRANLITIGLTGTVYSVGDPCNVFGGQIHINDTLTGTYTYDTSTPDSNPSNPAVGDYYHYSAPCGVSVTINGFNFRTDPNNIEFEVYIYDAQNSYADCYAFDSYHNSPLPDGTLVERINWQITDSTGTALSSDALPTTTPNLDDWDMDGGLFIFGPGHWGFAISADITSVVLIPEPATLLLLVFGVAICKRR
jgi:hypothetical protein